jgi:hypothetical protein
MIQPSKLFASVVVVASIVALVILILLSRSPAAFTRSLHWFPKRASPTSVLPSIGVSFLSYSNASSGPMTALFAISNSSSVDLHVVVAPPQTKDAGVWSVTQSIGPALSLRPGGVEIVEIIPAHGREAWRLPVWFERVPTRFDLVVSRMSRWLPHRFLPRFVERSMIVSEASGMWLTNSAEMLRSDHP